MIFNIQSKKVSIMIIGASQILKNTFRIISIIIDRVSVVYNFQTERKSTIIYTSYLNNKYIHYYSHIIFIYTYNLHYIIYIRFLKYFLWYLYGIRFSNNVNRKPFVYLPI